jgi:tRNA threonylcarbamoyladenosine biosynthesis protein TsaE
VRDEDGALSEPARPEVVACPPEQAGEVHRLTQAAFGPYSALDPPSGALQETLHQVRADVAAGRVAVALLDGRTVGCLRWEGAPGADLDVRRVAVDPSIQRRGVGTALMAWAEREGRARGCRAITVGVRVGLPSNLAFYARLGYQVIGEHRHDGYDRTTWVSMRKPLETEG